MWVCKSLATKPLIVVSCACVFYLNEFVVDYASSYKEY